jgi:hypothetical protein
LKVEALKPSSEPERIRPLLLGGIYIAADLTAIAERDVTG